VPHDGPVTDEEFFGDLAILDKLDVSTRTAAATIALRHGLA